MEKRYVMSPGPTPVPPEILLAMAQPIIHHRGPQFKSILSEVREGLKYVFQTKNEILIFAASGTGAMEGAVTNTLSPGDKALVVRGGKFGERWTEICMAYGIKVDNIDIEWGRSVNPDQIQKRLEKDPSIRAVFTQAHETSTGVKYPIMEIGDIINKHENTLIIVDAISAMSVFDIPVDTWHLDIVIGGSQKALMLPPGLSFVSVSDKAWKFVERSQLPKYYFDFLKERRYISKNQGAYTSPVSLIIGLKEALNMIRKEGLEAIFNHHKRLSAATKAAVNAMGLKLYSKENLSEALTAIEAPKGIDGQKIVSIMGEKYGITVAGGQGQAKGKIFRISHMGYIDAFDIIATISALELTLKELGYAGALGVGVKAAEEVLYQKQ